MGVSINLFKNYYEYLANKANVGLTLSNEQLSIVANAAQMLPFTADYETYMQTGVVSNYLKTFLKIGSTFQVNPNNPIVPYPADLQYLSSVRCLYNGTQYKVEWIDNIDVADVLRPNSLLAPVGEFPKYQYVDDGVQFFPNNIGIVYLDYFATPTQPFWNYTVVNNRQVYNPVGSIDFDWDIYFLNKIMAIFLQMVGINLSSTELAQFSQMFTAETKVVI
jgi:hypothetical protein